MVSVLVLADRAVRVRALAGDIVLCSWVRHLTLTVPLTTQEYKWAPVNCWGNLTNCGGVTPLLTATCYRIRFSGCMSYRLQGFTLGIAIV